jgi:hypothetical protein
MEAVVPSPEEGSGLAGTLSFLFGNECSIMG